MEETGNPGIDLTPEECVLVEQRQAVQAIRLIKARLNISIKAAHTLVKRYQTLRGIKPKSPVDHLCEAERAALITATGVIMAATQGRPGTRPRLNTVSDIYQALVSATRNVR